MIYVEPCIGQLLNVTLNGQNVTDYCHCLRVYESICKEWLTAQVILYDNNNVIEQMGIQAGMPAAFSFQSPPNPYIYNCGSPYGGGSYGGLQVLKMKGEQAPDSLTYSIYTIDLIGPVFYANMARTLLDESCTFVTGTAECKKIWDEYLPDNMQVLTQSIGYFGGEDAAHVNPGQKPLTAIHNIMREMVSATNQQLSNWLLYKNRDAVNLVQLPDLFGPQGINGPTGYLPPAPSAHGQQEYFVQKETWGAGIGGDNTGPGFNDRDIYHAIINVVAEAREGTGSGGSSSGVNLAAAVNPSQFVSDIMMGGMVSQGALGGSNMVGNQITNSGIFPNATAPWTKTPGEVGFSAQVKNSPQLVMKVPLQSGINVTVGKGIFAYLLPPLGLPGGAVGADRLTGPWLVTDLVHELYTDGRQASATSVFQLNQGPGDNLAD